jgi:putative flippase GtrA
MISMISNPKERSRFMRFAMVGVIGAVVDFGTFNILNSLLRLMPVVAQGFSFLAAVFSNFIWNRYWTYPDSRSKKISKQLIQFALVSTIGLLIRTPIFIFTEIPLTRFFTWMSVNYRLIPISWAQFLGHNGALALAVLVVMMWNFLVNRTWTYNDIS